MTNLFQRGNFPLHSGQTSRFKIDCDALTLGDWKTLADLISRNFRFREVVGIPTGGLLLAYALEKYIEPDSSLPVLIVDDVLTTGGSIRQELARIPNSVGVVVFARGKCPERVTPIFQLELGEMPEEEKE